MTDTDEWTTRQSALLDTVRDVAVSDADGAYFAARHLVRLLCLELGHAEPVEREGGVVGMLLGNPPKPAATTPTPRPIRDTPQA